MPAKSKKQQRLFGMVTALKKGELKNASEKVKDVASQISKKNAEDFARTKHTNLPEKKKQSNKKRQTFEEWLAIRERGIC